MRRDLLAIWPSWAACNRDFQRPAKSGEMHHMLVYTTIYIQIFTLIKEIYIYMCVHTYILESYMKPPNIIHIYIYIMYTSYVMCSSPPNIFHHTYTYTRIPIYHPSFSDFCSSQLILQFGPSNSPCFQHQAPTTHLVTRWT